MFISKKLLAIAAASLLGTAFAFPASAETISGQLEDADQDSIIGWVWDKEDYNHILDVELHIFPAGSEKEIVTLTAKADDYRDDLQTSIGDGYHGFSCSVDWNTLEGNDFFITAYAVSEQGKTQLPETLSYRKISVVEPNTAVAETKDPVQAESPVQPASPVQAESTAAPPQLPSSDSPVSNQAPDEASVGRTVSASSMEIGPGVKAPAPAKKVIEKGESLGFFATSGYCTCELCSNGESITFSGTVPQAGHTIAADLNVLPLNTRVIIDDIVYTVEDKGSSVEGNHIDIYYDAHEDAVAHGMQEKEVFRVKE